MGTLILLALAILLPPFQGVSSQQGTVCSQDTRAANLPQCLAAVRDKALDTVNSPYGEAYFTRCPPGGGDINCFEIGGDKITEPRSLAQLALGMHCPDLTTIDRFLSIQYISPPGSYTGCDHTYTYPNEKRFFIDPVSNRAYPSWDLREQPIYSWDYNVGEFFTLIARDANGATKHVVVNIEGNDVDNGVHLVLYHGPDNFRKAPRPAVFMLYRQTRPLLVERIPSGGFNVTDYAERNQLQGPIAFSWINTLYDAFGVQKYPFGENCASLVEDALEGLRANVEFLPNEVDLKVFLRVHRSTTAAPYDCGTYTITPPAREFYLDPIEPWAVVSSTADTRPSTLTTISMIMNKLNPRPNDFDGKLHTIMFISFTTQDLHGIIIDIEGDNVTRKFGQLSSGFQAVPFRMPVVRSTGRDHFFFILAYEQLTRLTSLVDVAPYVSQRDEARIGSPFFSDMDGFVADHQLTLVGVSRMMISDDDEYSACTR